MEIRNSKANYQASFKKAIIKKGVDELMLKYDKKLLDEGKEFTSKVTNVGFQDKIPDWKAFKTIITDMLEKTKYNLILSKEGAGADSKIGIAIENKAGNVIEKKYSSTINSNPYTKIEEGFKAVKELDTFSK